MRRILRGPRVAIASLALIAAACGSSGTEPETAAPASPLPQQTSGASPTGAPERALTWQRVDAAGPSALRDYTLTADPDGTALYLFGGRAKGDALGDLWAFEVARAHWARIDVEGPSARFGHNAAFLGGRLVVFGGQGGPGKFFNDVWAFDPAAKTWQDITPRGGEPAPRYGAGGAAVGGRFVVTHGFTDSGRFDDTWSLGTTWKDVSPRDGPRPVKRCLTRAVYLAATRRVVMFGGQTDGTPFLGDTWLYEPILRRWNEVKQGDAPPPRNLYAAAATSDAVYVFGGFGSGAPLDDLWSFNGRRWRQLAPEGSPPPARGGIEATIAGDSMYVFGGANDAGELADLWRLTLPA